jgi:hypothetical protein
MSVTLRGFTHTVRVTVVPGGAAGAFAIDGDLDASGDTLLSVRRCSNDLTTNADLTAEFSITGHNAITNVGGTASTGHFLVVTYAKATTE